MVRDTIKPLKAVNGLFVEPGAQPLDASRGEILFARVLLPSANYPTAGQHPAPQT
ncbi:hypothetical protein CA13_57040 [Planctomycetes bacterium CA13]|uniref:Uncharacterized protein n=1 Tax=Novipirellula herctigrandis TaxID=2527986 RepID=A0A5C5ZAI9_9BACT|nr:hypothetical protein CA13_57040 [Planctomycetes bacterium CA13]